MAAPKTPAPPSGQDVSQISREALLHASRNSAVQAIERTWRLDGVAAAARGRLGALRQRLLERTLWRLLAPLVVRQQEHNAAVLRALYAITEQSDHQYTLITGELAALGRHVNALADRMPELDQIPVELRELHIRCDHILQGVADLNERAVRERHTVAQQVRDFAEQLAGLEEAEMQIRAVLRGEPAAPPAGRAGEGA